MTNIKAILRNETTSSANNKLRKNGFIPAILYGGKDPNKKISIDKNSLKNVIDSESFLSKVFEIEIDGKKEKVLPRDISYFRKSSNIYQPKWLSMFKKRGSFEYSKKKNWVELSSRKNP